jgi:sortase A
MIPRHRRAIRIAEYVFAIVGVAALTYWLVAYIGSTRFQREASRKFTAELHRSKPPTPPTATPTAPPAPHASAIPKPGAVLGRLEIPRLHLAVMVVQGTDTGDLKRAAGHIPGTALPGQSGNIAIAAHRDTFFRPLRNIRDDDTIALTTLHNTVRYRVVSTQVVSPDDVRVLYPTRHDTLTLVTCYPFYYIGSAPKRFIVRAERIAPTNAARPAALAAVPARSPLNR